MEDRKSFSEYDEFPAPDASPINILDKDFMEITVELENGSQKVLAISSQDNPQTVAQEFSTKNSLSSSFRTSLEKLLHEKQQLLRNKDSFSNGFLKYAELLESKDHFATENYPQKKSKVPKKASIGSVHYQSFQRPKKTPTTSSMTGSKARTVMGKNYGEWLYLKGQKMKETVKTSIESKKRNEEQSQEELYTFTPQINKKSNLLSPRYNEKPEEILYRQAELYKDHLSLRKNEAEAAEMKQCTFKPRVRHPRDSQMRKSVHEELFQDSLKRKEKLNELTELRLQQDCSFKPNLSRTPKNRTESTEQLFERLTNSKKEFEKELERKRKEIQDTEIQSCQDFKPTIYKQPSATRNGKVWESLYNMKDLKHSRTAEISQKNQEIQEAKIAAQKVSENSVKIFEKFREKQYMKLFRLLDSDRDGKISASTIAFEELDQKLIDTLSPFLQWLQHLGSEVDYDQFAVLIEEFAKKLTVEERAVLLRREKKEEENTRSGSFVSGYSSMLAQKKRSSQPPDMYNRLTNERKLTEMKLEHQRNTRKQQEMQNCTFAPSILRL